jgi:hypothetical protein
MLLVKLVRLILNAFRHKDCKDQPMTKAEAEALVRELAQKHPDAADLDTTKSVVDVMKALNLDSGFKSRSHIAVELGLATPYSGTVDQNLWLRDKLLEKVAEGDVDSLRD